MGICCLEQNYKFLRNNVYRHRTVLLGNTVKLRENVVIHEECRVGEKTEILNSVIGSNCTIGQRCVLENAFIFDDVNIGDSCILKNCVIGNGVKISNECTLHDGTIVGDLCEIPLNQDLERSFVVAQQRDDDFDEGKIVFYFVYLDAITMQK